MAIDVDTLAICSYAVNDTMRTANKKTIDVQIQEMIDSYNTSTQATNEATAARIAAMQEE